MGVRVAGVVRCPEAAPAGVAAGTGSAGTPRASGGVQAGAAVRPPLGGEPEPAFPLAGRWLSLFRALVAEAHPAAHPSLMTRLEVLLEIYVLQGCAQDPDPPGDRLMLARGSTTTTLSFVAPPDVYHPWIRALHRVPQRDDSFCRAPGCSSRSHLEVHHIRFRSQGGTDHPWNKVTLCHAHHHHVLHRGALRVHGKAPDGLTWEPGTGRGQRPLTTLRGEHSVEKR